jgi:hypothetical protein
MKHIMKISYINVNIYDKTATSQQNSGCWRRRRRVVAASGGGGGLFECNYD